ncbi:MAG: D-TA family PLP-dependent enzyme [Planctomycetia bacterium]|nr:D-TA family PLP-dependent enzyme [Planctomycetia bacterium]
MTDLYQIADTSGILSPGLLFYADLIRQNLARAVELVGDPSRLCLHVKTHKCPEIVKLERSYGITKHKCATIAEAEMVAQCGAADALISYPIVGPNVQRLVALVKAYPATRFAALVDHPLSAQMLSDAMSKAGLVLDVLMDVDVGHHRTGIAPGPEAIALYEQMNRLSGLRTVGLHVYDGHNNQANFVERETETLKQFNPALKLRETLSVKGLPTPRLIAGGTPTFPIYARMTIPGLECSPGTLVLHDHGYGAKFADLKTFTPAALLLTRVISRPTPTRVTFDLGNKAVASDPGPGKRLILLDVPAHEQVLQNEEHLGIETPHASQFKPGDEVLAIPTHVCPTVALHRYAYVIEAGRLVGTWAITGRDRVLSV